MTGKFISNKKGFGFVAPDNGGADIFIPPRFVADAMDGDMVAYEITKEEASENESSTGKITKVLQRNPIIGTFFTEGAQGFVRPSDTKNPHPCFSLPFKSIKRLGLADGHMVMFTAKSNGDSVKNNEGKSIPTSIITEIIGHVNDPGIDVLALVRQANVPYEFSDKVISEATNLPDEIEYITGRLDLRDITTFTIDGDDTKDIDDAISFEKNPDGNYKLGVHIADVSHYVREGSSINAAALERGTSIYLADRVIPMLPHKLSSGICSLFPNVDRLTLSCLMTVCPQGNVLEYEIVESVINSKKRWTYNEVQDILDNPDESLPWHTTLLDMDDLRHILRTKRQIKGALDFAIPEAKIRVDETGRPISIETHERTQSTGIIEEFMILCNETIASHFLAMEVPFVYRNHESPGAEKIQKLATFSKSLGFKIEKLAKSKKFSDSKIVKPKKGKKQKVKKDSPIPLQMLLNVSANSPFAQSIAKAVLQSLPQARYTTSDPTHYGLASDAYCHFTSPIRRYADLQVHRIIKNHIKSNSSLDLEDTLPPICAICSSTERVAEVLEREVAQLKKVQFMSDQEGQNFEAVVSGVTAWGLYVMLPNTVEGIIPIENLQNNKFKFDKEKSVYMRKTKTLRLGEKLTVRLISANEEERKITFSIAQKFK